MTFRRHLLNMLSPLTERIGRIHAPFSVKAMSGQDYYTVRDIVRPGDILLSHTEGSLSNPLIPGYWKHVAFVKDSDTVIEAVGKGVVLSTMVDFVLKKDAVMVLSPLFADQQIMERAVEVALTLIGLPYDYLLEYDLGNNRAFYCAEVVWFSYEMAMRERVKAGEDYVSPFTPRVTLGMPTVVPQDFANAKLKWQQQITLPTIGSNSVPMMLIGDEIGTTIASGVFTRDH